MHARIAARWTEQNLRRRLRVARLAPDFARQWIALKVRARSDLLLRCRAIDKGSLSLAWLQERLESDTTMRRLALQHGSQNDQDPRCLLSAIIEAWTLLLIYEARGVVDNRRVRSAEREIETTFR